MSIVSINENLGAGAPFAHVLGSWLRSALGKTVSNRHFQTPVSQQACGDLMPSRCGRRGAAERGHGG